MYEDFHIKQNAFATLLIGSVLLLAGCNQKATAPAALESAKGDNTKPAATVNDDATGQVAPTPLALDLTLPTNHRTTLSEEQRALFAKPKALSIDVFGVRLKRDEGSRTKVSVQPILRDGEKVNSLSDLAGANINITIRTD